MSGFFDADKLAFLQGSKPFLGPNARRFIEAIESFAELMSTEAAVKMQTTLSSVLHNPPPPPPGDTEADVVETSGFLGGLGGLFRNKSVFVIFLILILLFAGDK